MYFVEKINIKRDHELFAYCEDITNKAKNMYNVANYYIRNTMTALSKDPKDLTENEQSVLNEVIQRITEFNSKSSGGKKHKAFDIPTIEKWFLGYTALDAVFKTAANVDYRAHHIHVIQNAIKDCCESWKGYFESLKVYKADQSAFNGKPKLPGYVKVDHRTAVLSNQASRIKNGSLSFPKSKIKLNVSELPHASNDKLIEVRIKPHYDVYQIQIVVDDGTPEKETSDGRIVIPRGERVTMIDLGLNNFAAIADNEGANPIVIKGGVLKAINQWYNKRMAELRGILMKGHDPKAYHAKTSKQMNALSRRRDNMLTDTFYKIAHRICRVMEARNSKYVIVGKSTDWKQEINLGHKTNQEFVQIPHAKFIATLKTVARKYGITVIEQEESYTSQSSFLDSDPIPVYGDKAVDDVEFSGKRVKRGLYRSKDGRTLNADINGAANIGRKYDPALFAECKDYTYLCTTVETVTFKDMNPSAA